MFWEEWLFVEDECMAVVIGEVLVVRIGDVIVTIAEEVVVGLVIEFLWGDGGSGEEKLI
jgi:hypothetical protein